MRCASLVPVICAAALAVSCGGSETILGPGPMKPAVQPIDGDPGTLVVFVHWGEQGIPDKRVELVELHAARTTDESGLAEFVAAAGDYTLRAYEINRGPTWEYIDTRVTIKPGEEVRAEIVDCLPCN